MAQSDSGKKGRRLYPDNRLDDDNIPYVGGDRVARTPTVLALDQLGEDQQYQPTAPPLDRPGEGESSLGAVGGEAGGTDEAQELEDDATESSEPV